MSSLRFSYISTICLVSVTIQWITASYCIPKLFCILVATWFQARCRFAVCWKFLSCMVMITWSCSRWSFSMQRKTGCRVAVVFRVLAIFKDGVRVSSVQFSRPRPQAMKDGVRGRSFKHSAEGRILSRTVRGVVRSSFSLKTAYFEGRCRGVVRLGWVLGRTVSALSV